MTFCDSVMPNTVSSSPKLKETTPPQLRKQQRCNHNEETKRKLDLTDDDLLAESKAKKILLKYYVRATLDLDDF